MADQADRDDPARKDSAEPKAEREQTGGAMPGQRRAGGAGTDDQAHGTMAETTTAQGQSGPDGAARSDLPDAARRALAEADARRRASPPPHLPTELGGRRDGLEPVRYGDWEKNGLAVDF